MSKLATLAPLAFTSGGTILSLISLKSAEDPTFRRVLWFASMILGSGTLVAIYLSLPSIVEATGDLITLIQNGNWGELALVILGIMAFAVLPGISKMLLGQFIRSWHGRGMRFATVVEFLSSFSKGLLYGGVWGALGYILYKVSVH